MRIFCRFRSAANLELMRFYEMSGRRCGDLGERCKRSQRLRLDLACRPRCAWTRDPLPYMPKAPVSRQRKGRLPPV
jgi:hypothetical protein